MATIESYPTKAGTRYRVRYRTPDRRTTSKRGFTTKRDAKAFAATVEVRKMSGDFIPESAGRATISEIAVTWQQLAEANLAPGSWRNYETAWRVHVEPKWGRTQVRDITLLGVETWLATMPRADRKPGRPSAPTVERAYTVLLAVLDIAVKDKRLPRNPARGAALPGRVEKRRVYLTAEQVARIADHSGEHADLVLTLAFTGVRWGEAAALRGRSWNPATSRLAVTSTTTRAGGTIHEGPPKDREHRTVPVPSFLADRITARDTAPTALMFPGPSGDYIVPPDVRHGWFVKALDAAGVERITPHDLRHTCASLAVSAGANVKALQRMLGHARAELTLSTYADLYDTDLDDVGSRLDAIYRSF